MWTAWQSLSSALADDLRRFPEAESLAITMTGELADCFADRESGVAFIVDAASQAARDVGIANPAFYGVDGSFRDAQQAKANANIVAAANWHALASYVGFEIASDALLIDIGSTTTDIVPIKHGKVATGSMTDFDRLVEGSLVYVGCRRTPVCSLVSQVELRGHQIPVMNELFATTDDARLVLGLEPPDRQDTETADGKPRTVTMAANRLARMIGLDVRSLRPREAEELAGQVIEAAIARIELAFTRLDQPGTPIVISGHGRDLIPCKPDREIIDLAEVLTRAVSRCAPSLAVARLYESRPRCGVS